MNEAEPSLFVDTKTAARMLGISRTLLYALMAREEVPSKRFGHRREG